MKSEGLKINMEFLSEKITEIKKTVAKTDLTSEQREIFTRLIELTETALLQQDLLTARIMELEEKSESAEQQLQDLQVMLLQNFDLDECGMPIRFSDEIGDGHSHEGHCHDENCHCDDCDPERPDDFYTLQCPFCEELFFIEREELDLDVECPFCSKEVKASENIVKP